MICESIFVPPPSICAKWEHRWMFFSSFHSFFFFFLNKIVLERATLAHDFQITSVAWNNKGLISAYIVLIIKEEEGSFIYIIIYSGSQADLVNTMWNVAGYQREKKVLEGFSSLGRSGMAYPATRELGRIILPCAQKERRPTHLACHHLQVMDSLNQTSLNNRGIIISQHWESRSGWDLDHMWYDEELIDVLKDFSFFSLWALLSLTWRFALRQASLLAICDCSSST